MAAGEGDPSVEQIGLFAGDAGEQRLEVEPAGEVTADLGAGEPGHLRVDQDRRARGLGHQLCVTTAFHGDEPPRGFSTDCPTVRRPWLRRFAAFSPARAWAMRRLPSSMSSTTPE